LLIEEIQHRSPKVEMKQLRTFIIILFIIYSKGERGKLSEEQITVAWKMRMSEAAVRRDWELQLQTRFRKL
jgi:hypothetical protein